MASNRPSATSRVTLGRSRRSARTFLTAEPRSCVSRRWRTETSCPRATSRATIARPMNSVPPMTRIRMAGNLNAACVARYMRRWERMLVRLRTDLGRAKYLLYAFIIAATIAFGWLATQSYSVYRLTRGVGDTWFHTADGRRWFGLDEQRHDVPIAAISPHLQHAFVAVEDHRFFLHPGVDPIALGRAVFRNVRGGSLQGGS